MNLQDAAPDIRLHDRGERRDVKRNHHGIIGRLLHYLLE